MHEIPSPVLLSGTSIKNGEGQYVIIAVGDISCVGKILKSLKAKSTQTPLQMKLAGVADFIGKIGLYTAIVTVGVLIIRYIITRATFGGWSTDDIGTIFEYFVLGITVLIVAIPEGLPLAVTIALAYSVGQMYNENNYVKTMMSCEVMGNANYICSDKTGTLTKNEMTVVALWNNEKETELPENQTEINLEENTGKETANLLAEAIICNTIPKDKGGNATEIACLDFLKICKYDPQDLMKKYLSNEKDYQRFFFSSERKKMSTIIKKDEEHHVLYIKGGAEKILSGCNQFQSQEGAVPMSTEIKSSVFNTIEKFNGKALRSIVVAYRNLGKTDYGDEHNQQDDKGNYLVEEENLVLLCVIGIRDTLRAGVENAVETCFNAGINVKMVTGDNITTAKAIARNCNILKSDHKYSAIIGEEFSQMLGGIVLYCNECKKNIDNKEMEAFKEKKRKEEQEKKEEEMKKKEQEKKEKIEEARRAGKEYKEETNEEGDGGEDEEPVLEKQEQIEQCPVCKNNAVIEKVKNLSMFQEINPHLCVIARSRPEDKYLLVTALKEIGNTVAVTGDGTNDAAALRKADIGFAMNIAGTDIAKNAADILLLDDNFVSIITAIKWGRNIYESIQKFIQFQLSVNICALAVAFVGSCVVGESPLSALQLIWINVIMDSFASLALATDPPTDELLTRLPHSKDENIISRKMMKHLLAQSVYMITVILIILFAGEYFLPEEEEIIDGHRLDRDGCVRTGRKYNYKGDEEGSELYSKKVYDALGPSRHFTILFTTFVFMQIVNEYNCRKLYDEVNIFKGFLSNPISIIIRAIETVVQVVISQFGNVLFNIYPDGMTWYQWLICIAFSLGSFAVRLALLLLPEDRCCKTEPGPLGEPRNINRRSSIRSGSKKGSMI
eukprot:TRINITY_DN3290_c0_g1_i2.p1 TRINITY_DN3290_c0_g1~~TRINITY_DN3290_c0_g1_i2.p1  ORF type:complete len:897 (+),score=191.65 TRINITY_DN3290_c0_g1_i2:872-3562(+)